MDQDRTMQFILDNLAAVTASQQQAEVRAARVDRRIKGLQELVLTGMRLIARLQRNHRVMQAQLKGIVATQRRMEQKIDRLFGSGKNGSNGHAGS